MATLFVKPTGASPVFKPWTNQRLASEGETVDAANIFYWTRREQEGAVTISQNTTVVTEPENQQIAAELQNIVAELQEKK